MVSIILKDSAYDSAEQKMQLFHLYKAHYKTKGRTHAFPAKTNPYTTFTGSISPLV